MKFVKGKNSDFYTTLISKVDNYFEDNNLSKTGDARTIIKGALLLAIFISCYCVIIIVQPRIYLQLICTSILGITSVLLFFNVVHDASHRILFKNQTLNKILCYIGELAGVSTYMWHIRHDMQHHSFTNVLGADINDDIPLIRLTPHQPLKAIHKYQYIYAPFLYLFYSLYWIFILDTRCFVRGEICGKRIRHRRAEWVKLIFFKMAYIFYMLIVPLFVLPYKSWVIVAGFFVMHFFAGVLVAVISVLGHTVEGTEFSVPTKDGEIANSWSEHELATTADFANDSKLIAWMTGGLNTHICHHLFPNICHSHYFKLTPIIRSHCAEYGLTLNEYSFFAAIRSHIGYLKKLGNNA